ncbi:MAG: hypothetical protein M1824_002298 [Vezdaea acicularis]|nr:MAG: hypothetical protein M1824_002298 [Vezdaea acicularis]
MLNRPRGFTFLRFLLLAFFAYQVAAVITNPDDLSFDQCGAIFQDAVDRRDPTALKYQYNGTIYGIKSPAEKSQFPPFITLEGCIHYCGSDLKAYNWSDISDTITTWVLPLAGGLILQAPFESNQRLSTFFILCRWLGSPITCLMAMFWNIRITGRCAILLDMAVSRDRRDGYESIGFTAYLKSMWRKLSDEFTLVARITVDSAEKPQEPLEELRDGLYLLSVLNQYAFQHRNPTEFKRLVLFAFLSSDKALRERDAPQMGNGNGNGMVANQHVQNNLPPQHSQAIELHARERPVHQLIEKRRQLAASVRRSRKHGVVQVLVSMFWFLVALILSIYKAFGQVGINAVGHNLAIGLLMSWLPVLISTALVDRNPTNSEYVQRRLNRFLEDADLILHEDPDAIDPRLRHPFLTHFCGQGRKAWHYGVTHSILRYLEQNLPHRQRGLIEWYNDGRILNEETRPMDNTIWQPSISEGVLSLLAFANVVLAIGGAFTISYREPTVGLGCRSGGYMIFGTIAVFSFVLEMSSWAGEGLLERRAALHPITSSSSSTNTYSKRFSFLRLFITLAEVTNAAWLVYIIMAQTWGTYNSCACASSNWGHGPYYYLFSNSGNAYIDAFSLNTWWIIGTVLGSLPLLTILYIVYEWCVQSFLWTEDYDAAMRGLHRVRLWRYCFYWRWPGRLARAAANALVKAARRSEGRTLVPPGLGWTR